MPFLVTPTPVIDQRVSSALLPAQVSLAVAMGQRRASAGCASDAVWVLLMSPSLLCSSVTGLHATSKPHAGDSFKHIGKHLGSDEVDVRNWTVKKCPEPGSNWTDISNQT